MHGGNVICRQADYLTIVFSIAYGAKAEQVLVEYGPKIYGGGTSTAMRLHLPFREGNFHRSAFGPVTIWLAG